MDDQAQRSMVVLSQMVREVMRKLSSSRFRYSDLWHFEEQLEIERTCSSATSTEQLHAGEASTGPLHRFESHDTRGTTAEPVPISLPTPWIKGIYTQCLWRLTPTKTTGCRSTARFPSARRHQSGTCHQTCGLLKYNFVSSKLAASPPCLQIL